MSEMVQIRNVPDTLHRKLKVRAADSGQTLSDYLLAELERLAARPTRLEMLTRIHSRKRVTLKTQAAMYVALAEALDATVITCDTRPANASRRRAHIEVIV